MHFLLEFLGPPRDYCTPKSMFEDMFWANEIHPMNGKSKQDVMYYKLLK